MTALVPYNNEFQKNTKNGSVRITLFDMAYLSEPSPWCAFLCVREAQKLLEEVGEVRRDGVYDVENFGRQRAPTRRLAARTIPDHGVCEEFDCVRITHRLDCSCTAGNLTVVGSQVRQAFEMPVQLQQALLLKPITKFDNITL
jgi:hypothetical protein